jgi:hypothetical protein
MASDRDRPPLSFAPHFLISAIRVGGNLMPTKGSLPVAGLPRFLGFTPIDFAIFRFYPDCEPKGSTNPDSALTFNTGDVHVKG